MDTAPPGTYTLSLHDALPISLLRLHWCPRGQRNCLLARDLPQQIGLVGDDPVDADLDHARHVLTLVDRPDHDTQPERVRLRDQRGDHIAETGRPDRAARSLDG